MLQSAIHTIDIYEELMIISHKMVLRKLSREAKLDAIREIRKLLMKHRDDLEWYEVEVAEDMIRCIGGSLGLDGN